MKTYEETDRWEESVLEKVREKMKWVCEKNREKIPYTTEPDGRYDDRSDASRNWNGDDGLNWWTNGFWSGLLWRVSTSPLYVSKSFSSVHAATAKM